MIIYYYTLFSDCFEIIWHILTNNHLDITSMTSDTKKEKKIPFNVFSVSYKKSLMWKKNSRQFDLIYVFF